MGFVGGASLLLGAAVGLTGEALLAAVVIAGLPTAQNVFTYAVRYDRGVVLARESVLVTTILSVPVVLVAAAVLAGAPAGAGPVTTAAGGAERSAG